MKSKLIKKILSTLLAASAFGSTPCFVSAGGNRKSELSNKMAEFGVIIQECNEALANFQKQKEIEIKPIIEKITANLETMDSFTKLSNKNEISNDDYTTACQNLEEQNKELSAEIELIEEIYKNNIKDSSEILKKINTQKAEIQKELDKIKKEEIENLIKQTEDLKKMCSNPKINKYVKDNAITLSMRVKTACENNRLTEENIKIFEKELEDLKAEFSAFDQIKKIRLEKEQLWKKINSGSQNHNPVKGNLCWLHSSTNVLNYYNNMENKAIFKGSNAIVKQYIAKVNDKNIDGGFKEVEDISDYLKKCGLNMLRLTISSASKDKEGNIINTAKSQLKAHFNSNKNHSPVIVHKGAGGGHFVTIADYDENEDQFLIVDSANIKESSEAQVEWENSEEFLKKLGKSDCKNSYFIELDFTSNTSESRSLNVNIKYDNSITQQNVKRNEYEHMDEAEYQTSIDALNNIIENY